MSGFRYVALDAATAARIRATMTDDWGNALHVQISTDAGNPCRSCLRLTDAGTPLILFAHRPFAHAAPYAETGPVFIHAEPCTPYAHAHDFPPDFRPRTLVFRAYDTTGAIATAELRRGDEAEATLERLFAQADVATVHVRNPAWGCYDFRVERA